MGSFACVVVRLARQLATQGCDAAPLGSSQLRDLLARPLLQLLHSPLLDLLARMQHVPVDAGCYTDAVHSSASLPPPCGLIPLRQMQPDADDAVLMMQVRRIEGGFGTPYFRFFSRGNN